MTLYEEYVKKYAKKHGISIEEAEQHALVKAAKEQYEQYEQGDDTTKMCGWKETT